MKNTVKILLSADVKTYVSVAEAARMLNVNKQTIRDYLAKRRFTPYKFYTLTLLSREEIAK